MFQLLQPIWLYAIAGIAIPLIIHLWDVRGGKRLQVGSILLIHESARQQGRSLRLTDILLLILRCLLIILLALVLAQPTWKKQLISVNEKGWVMIEKQSLQEAYKNSKPSIDSLLKAGYKFHYFNTGFEPGRFEDALANDDSIPGNDISYWALLKQLNEQVPADLPVHLFTNDHLKRFGGSRPEISMALTWNTFTPADTIEKAAVIAYRTATDSVRVITANSNPSATFYISENIHAAGKSTYNDVVIDTAGIYITIYTDQFTTDANYVKAAIDATQQYTQRNIKVSIVNDPAEIKPGDWLFWLSEKPVPSQLSPTRVFVYEKGKEQAIHSWIAAGNNMAINQEPVMLSRRIQIPASAINFETIWKDGFGNPLLSLERTSKDIYHFYSRFNPAWNDLPWSPQFAEMIFDLIIEQPADKKNVDKRVIDVAQLQPQFAKEQKGFDKEKFVETTGLGKFFWLAAFILFCIERYLSLKNNNKNGYA